MNEPLDLLLEQLNSGDDEAAARVFLAYEPYLRQAVRRHLSGPFRAKFDSSDVVLSIWADLLRGFRKAGWRFVDADHLRGFLVTATRNRLVDRIRQHREAVRREEPLNVEDLGNSLPSPQPSPNEVVEVSDLWERIQAHCPPEHRPILGLRRQGYSLSEIAEQTGLHPDSIRRILRILARKIAFEQAPTPAPTQPEVGPSTVPMP
jgi:RNA polymerase sigma factor (sigma-70 family)